MVAVGSKSVLVSNNTAVGTPLVGMTGNAVFIGFDEHGVVIFGVLIEQARLDEGGNALPGDAVLFHTISSRMAATKARSRRVTAYDSYAGHKYLHLRYKEKTGKGVAAVLRGDGLRPLFLFNNVCRIGIWDETLF